MKRGGVAIILIFFLISCSSQKVHFIGGEEAKPGPTTIDEMTNRLTELAVTNQSKIVSTFFDP